MILTRVVLVTSQIVLATAACADDGGMTQLSFKATAPATCAFSSAPRMLSAQNMALTGAGEASAAVTITDMIDSATARLKPAIIALAFRAVCNVPHNLTLTSARGALIAANQAALSQGSFLDKVRYRATAQWGTQTAVLAVDGGSGEQSAIQAIAGAQVGDVNVEIKIDESDNDPTLPVLAGTYEDVLTIFVSARL
jgi:hypothetical protein